MFHSILLDREVPFQLLGLTQLLLKPRWPSNALSALQPLSDKLTGFKLTMTVYLCRETLDPLVYKLYKTKSIKL